MYYQQKKKRERERERRGRFGHRDVNTHKGRRTCEYGSGNWSEAATNQEHQGWPASTGRGKPSS